MQDQENIKNQEEQENQLKEDNGAMTKLQNVFNLEHDQAHPDKIDAVIRANTRVTGTNMWVLMFAIAVSSIGLNVNSTAVVIGAMLISPLMGPIVGMGYGLAVGDTALIRQAMRNIIIFVVISVITATLYFLLTPLEDAQSELLARTQPTLWDVLIAFFGGSAGIVALTRKEGGNAIPGVAIATALMPPLCTAGYGLAHGNWHYFLGVALLSRCFISFCHQLRVHRFFDLVVFQAAQAAAQGVGKGIQTPVAQHHYYCRRVGCDDSERLYGIRTGASGNLQNQSQCRHCHCAATGRFFRAA